MIFGLAGWAGSGKDTVASILLAKGWERVAFGDKLKECLYALNPMVQDIRYANGCLGFVSLQGLVDELGWDEVKQWSEVRSLLQRMGTEVGRNVIHEHIWVNLVIPPIMSLRTQKNIVITDVRYPNEVQLIDRLNGKLILIQRAGIEPPNNHTSESLARSVKPDYTINNDGDLNDLAQQVEQILNSHDLEGLVI